MHTRMWLRAVATAALTLTASAQETHAQPLVSAQLPQQRKATTATTTSVQRRIADSLAALKQKAAIAASSAASQTLKMPSFIDSTLSGATRFLSRNKFAPVIVWKDTSEAAVDGRVFAQSPRPGQPLPTPSQARIELSVYRFVARSSTTVPPTVGRELRDALRLIRAARLSPTYAPLGLRRGDSVIVVDQKPLAGATAFDGDTVRLSVGVLRPVPNVVGLSTVAAADRLAVQGFVPSTVAREYDDSIAAGFVSRQRPTAPDVAPAGSTVSLWLSLGARPRTPTRIMPPLVNRTLEAARDTLRAHGLRASRVDSIEDANRAGLVIAQTPAAGAPIAPGEAITVQVARAPQQRRVPWVVGMTQAAATIVLRDAGFRPIANLVSGQLGRAGRVLVQRPDSSAALPPGGTVVILVADSVAVPARPRMPNVVGERESAARDSLRPLRVRIRVDSQRTLDRRQVGLVLRQSPDAGEEIAAGAEVALFVGEFQAPQQPQQPPQPPPPPQQPSPQQPPQPPPPARTDADWWPLLTILAVAGVGGTVWYWRMHTRGPHGGPGTTAPPPPPVVDVTLHATAPPMPSIDFPDDRSVIETTVTLTTDEPIIDLVLAGPLVDPREA